MHLVLIYDKKFVKIKKDLMADNFDDAAAAAATAAEASPADIRTLLEVNLILLKLKEYLFCASPVLWQQWKEVRIRLAYIFSLKFHPRPSLATQLVDIMLASRETTDDRQQGSSVRIGSLVSDIAAPDRLPLTGNANQVYYTEVDEYVSKWLAHIRNVVSAFYEDWKVDGSLPMQPSSPEEK